MTFEPTFEMYELVDRIGKGDVVAIRDLWPLVFPDRPFDSKRPAMEVVQEIVDKFNEFSEAQKAAAPPPEPTTDEVIREAIAATSALVNAIMEGSGKKKR